MAEVIKGSGMTAGLDLGDRFSQVVVLDEAGQVIEEGRVRTTEEALRRRFSGVARMRIALETGTHSPWVSRLLTECGHEVIVANSRQLWLIYENPSKDDRVDALYLARLARLDPALLAPVTHRSARAQEDLALLRSRDALVSARTGLINHVRGGGQVCRGPVAGLFQPQFSQEGLAESARASASGALAGRRRDRVVGRSDQEGRQAAGGSLPGELSADEAASASAGSRADHVLGLCSDAGGSGAVPEEPRGGSLSRVSPRTQAIGGF